MRYLPFCDNGSPSASPVCCPSFTQPSAVLGVLITLVILYRIEQHFCINDEATLFSALTLLLYVTILIS